MTFFLKLFPFDGFNKSGMKSMMKVTNLYFFSSLLADDHKKSAIIFIEGILRKKDDSECIYSSFDSALMIFYVINLIDVLQAL